MGIKSTHHSSIFNSLLYKASVLFYGASLFLALEYSKDQDECGSFGWCDHCQLSGGRGSFNGSICDHFAHLDADHDGLLSYAEMLKELQSLRVLETHFGVDVKTDPDELLRVYDSLFLQFDHDLNGTVDLEEFKAETKQMMLAMANGMGFLPVQMALEDGSFLKKAVDWESAKLAA